MALKGIRRKAQRDGSGSELEGALLSRGEGILLFEINGVHIGGQGDVQRPLFVHADFVAQHLLREFELVIQVGGKSTSMRIRPSYSSSMESGLLRSITPIPPNSNFSSVAMISSAPARSARRHKDRIARLGPLQLRALIRGSPPGALGRTSSAFPRALTRRYPSSTAMTAEGDASETEITMPLGSSG